MRRLLGVVMLAGVLGAGAAAAAGASGRTAAFAAPEEASASATADSSEAAPPPAAASADTTRRARKPSHFSAPKWVMFRSLVLPGWGQLHNRAWLKAAAVGGSEIWLGLRLLSDRRKLNDLNAAASQARAAGDEDRELALIDDYNSRLSSYQSRQWLLGGLMTYALLDAYIDAQFRGFRVEFEGDPALSGDRPAELRIAIRGTF